MKLITSHPEIIDYFKKNDRAYTFNQPINPRPPNCSNWLAVAINKAYTGGLIARTSRYINDAIYSSGYFKGQKVKEILFSELCKFINDILEEKITNCLDFNKKHDEYCTIVTGEYIGNKGKGRITYGKAQKLVNITLKYLFVEYFDQKLEISKSEQYLEKLFPYFHCPIDSFVMRKIFNLYKKTSLFPGIIVLGETAYYQPAGLPKASWSNFSRDHYLNFQKNLRKCLKDEITLLEVDFLLWAPSRKAPMDKIAPEIARSLGCQSNHISCLRNIVFI